MTDKDAAILALLCANGVALIAIMLLTFHPSCGG